MNRKYKEDQFVSIVKSHKSNQLNMNSTNKAAAKVAEDWSQSNEKSDMKKEDIQHLKARLWNSLKKKWERKVKDGVKGRYERRNLKWNNSSTRSGITNKVSCKKKTQTETGSNCRDVNNYMRQ